MTTIPQDVWEPFKEILDVEELPDAPLRGAGGPRLKAKRCEIRLGVGGKIDGEDYFDLGPCEVRLAFDKDAAEADAKRPLQQGETKYDRVSQLPLVLLGLGGGTLRKGGLCINWSKVKPEAFLIEVAPTTGG
jgi:hypothetical protein